MKKTALAVAVLLVACGPSVNGRVSGYALDVNEALFSTVTDGKGANIGAVLVLSDQKGVCAQLTATKAPANAQFTLFMLTRQADGKPLSPDIGEYVVGAAPGSAASAAGMFMRTDGNGTNAIPAANRGALSGLVRVTDFSLDKGVMGVQLDAKFGAQSDVVSGALRADRCIIDSASLMRGFLLSGEVSHPSGSVSQSPECADFVACYAAFGGTTSLADTYGPNGSCWKSSVATADSCTSACRSSLTSLRNTPSAPATCWQ